MRLGAGLDGEFHLLDVLEDAPGGLGIGDPFRREPDPAGGALHQPDAETLFQTPDDLADGGWRHPQLSCRG